jgi:hypothetical protein
MNHKAAGKHTYYEYKPFSFIYSTKIDSLLPMNKELDNKLNVSYYRLKMQCTNTTEVPLFVM